MTGPAGLRGRIFLVGVPRSGTTLLQALIAAHPDVTSFTESHLFSRPFRRLPLLGAVLTSDPAPRLAEFLEENDAPAPTAAQWFGPPSPPALRHRALLPLHTRTVARRLVTVLDELAGQRGAPVWLEKTPRHLHAVSLLQAVCDDGVPTHFVHLVRDGLQTVASLYRASRDWERPYDLDTCVRRWNRDVALTAACLGTPGHHGVLYEDLAANPETVLRALLANLGLPWQAGLVEDFGATVDAVRTPAERWKEGTARGIRPSATADQVLTPAQRRRVEASLRRTHHERVAARVSGRVAHG